MSSPQTTLGKYQIIREIARSNDIVYEAYDPLMNRRVALKELAMPSGSTPVQREERINRFKREARAAGTLAHPNIMTVYELGEEGDRFYIAMEFLDGHTLRNEIDTKGALPPVRAVEIARDVLRGLSFMHDKGVIHRDIKPDNIQLLSDGRIKLTDFGIARLTFEPNLTMDGQVFGTPSYMSPEQVVGREIDARSDLFSLGVVLYEMLSGNKPFTGDSVVSITYAIMNKDPEPPKDVNYAIGQVLTRSLDKSPALRYASANDFSEALGEAIAAATSGPVVDYVPQPTMGPMANPYSMPTPGLHGHAQHLPTPPPVLYPYNAYSSGPAQPPVLPPNYMNSAYVPNPQGLPIYYPPPARQPFMSPDTKEFIGRFFLWSIVVIAFIGVVIALVSALSSAFKLSEQEGRDKQVVAAVHSEIRGEPIDEQIQRLEDVSDQLSSSVVRAQEQAYIAELYEERGSRFEGVRDYASAEKNYMRASELDPQNSAYFSDLGRVYARVAQNIDDAQQRMEVWAWSSQNWTRAASLAHNPQERTKLRDYAARATYDYGTELYDVGQLDRARSQFMQARDIAPPNSRVSAAADEMLGRLDVPSSPFDISL